MAGAVVRFQTPLEEIPDDTPSLIERMCVYLSAHVDEKDLFGTCVKCVLSVVAGGTVTDPHDTHRGTRWCTCCPLVRGH